MKKKGLFLFAICLICFGCSFGLQGKAAEADPTSAEEPLLSIACISDLHADYGLQSKAPYIRNSVIQTLNRIWMEEDADLLLVGGDITSDNADSAEHGGWKYSTYEKVVEAYRTATKNATESGRSLWACGNHDYEAGAYDGYDAYAGFVSIMNETCGEPISSYLQRNDKSLKDLRYPDFPMGLHYQIEGFDFIILNPPYSKKLTYSSGTLQWLNGRLRKIGADKTVFLLSHYPLTGSRGLSTPTYGLSGSVCQSLTNILNRYPNVIYLYGHNHGGGESVYISNDTFERITFYDRSGAVAKNRNKVPASFISSFMGSMSYYNYSLDPGLLTEDDPAIVQGLMIYVYGDRIVFQMKNYGTHRDHANRGLQSWTVMRDVAGSLNEDLPSTENFEEITTGEKTQMELFDIVLASVGGVIALGGIATLVIVLYRMWKKDRATPYKDEP